jgi:hypothetical protein
MRWRSDGVMVLMANTFKDKVRYDHICICCQVHTLQVLTMKGWVCKECSVLQTMENIKKETRECPMR